MALDAKNIWNIGGKQTTELTPDFAFAELTLMAKLQG
jgi:hypothetical protein